MSHAQEHHFKFGFENDGDGNAGGAMCARNDMGSHDRTEVGDIGSGKESLQPVLD